MLYRCVVGLYNLTRLHCIFILAPPPLGTLPPPDEEEIDGTSFTVKLTKASNKLGVVQ